jgi:nucleoside phosphorylase
MASYPSVGQPDGPLPADLLRVFDAMSGIDIGIVTALPVECAAVQMLVDGLRDRPVSDDPHHYCSGSLPSKDPNRPHGVVVALQTRDGTRNAASTCTDMIRSFPEVREIVMCGIAGGIPIAKWPIRLGDIVVSAEGLVDYDHVYTVDGTDTLRRSLQGLSNRLIRATRELRIKELTGNEPWRDELDALSKRNSGFRRPPDSADPLRRRDTRAAESFTGNAREDFVRRPLVHRGPVGTADRLLRDAKRRAVLAERYGIIAIEMEGAGIAEGTDLHERRWFVVRGISDYCDNAKNDIWHGYAALSAAVFTRALLAECRPFPDRAGQPKHRSSAGGLQQIVSTLLAVEQFRDDYQRRAIFALLPPHIRTAIPDSVVGRLHVVGMVETCQHFPDGMDALLDALRLTVGESSPAYQNAEQALLRHWPRA